MSYQQNGAGLLLVCQTGPQKASKGPGTQEASGKRAVILPLVLAASGQTAVSDTVVLFEQMLCFGLVFVLDHSKFPIVVLRVELADVRGHAGLFALTCPDSAGTPLFLPF